MKNFKWRKVVSLCRIQTPILNKAFVKWSIFLPFFILVWSLLISKGEILSSCSTITRWILMLPIVFFPTTIMIYFIVGTDNKLILPASNVEKYTSIWLTSLFMISIEILISMTIILPLLYGLNLIVFHINFVEILNEMNKKLSLGIVLLNFAFSIGITLFIISQFITSSKRRVIRIVLILSLILILNLIIFLPHSVKNIYITLFSGVFSICCWLWGYHSFKCIQLKKKE